MPRGGVSGSGAVLPDYAKCNLTNYSMPKSEAPAYNNNNGGFNPETGMP